MTEYDFITAIIQSVYNGVIYGVILAIVLVIVIFLYKHGSFDKLLSGNRSGT